MEVRTARVGVAVTRGVLVARAVAVKLAVGVGVGGTVCVAVALAVAVAVGPPTVCTSPRQLAAATSGPMDERLHPENCNSRLVLM